MTVRRGAPAAKPSAGLLLAAVAIPFLFYGLGSYSVVNGDEAIYHAVAVHMVESGDWLSLVFRGAAREYDTFMNAPLQYWLRAVLIAIAGDSPFTMRAMSAGMGVASVWATWRLCVELGSRRAAWIAGSVLLTTYQFVYLHGARTGELETTLCLLITLSALAFVRALSRDGSFVGHHVCVALLAGVKLPILAIPLLAAGAAFAFVPEVRRRFRDYARAAVLVLPLGLVWHVWNAIDDPDAFWRVAGAMTAHATGRSAATGPPGLLENLRFYAGVILFGAFPWSLVHPVAVATLLERGRRRADLRVVVCFVLAIAVFYLLVAKRFPWYVTPLYPFLSLGVGFWFDDLFRSSASASASATPAPRARILLAGSVALLCFVSIGATPLNPFAEQASRIPMQAHWRIGGVAGPVFAAVAALFLWAGLGLAARRWPGVRCSGFAAAGVGGLLFATAVHRVVTPLAHVDYTSPVESLRAELASQTAAGRGEMDWPYRVPGSPPPVWIARYYLGDRYELDRIRDGARDELWVRGPRATRR